MYDGHHAQFASVDVAAARSVPAVWPEAEGLGGVLLFVFLLGGVFGIPNAGTKHSGQMNFLGLWRKKGRQGHTVKIPLGTGHFFWSSALRKLFAPYVLSLPHYCNMRKVVVPSSARVCMYPDHYNILPLYLYGSMGILFV